MISPIKGLSKNSIIFILAAILLLSIGAVLKFWIAPHIFFTQTNSAHDIVDQTYNAENALDQYEWFKTQKQKIDAQKDQIQNVRDQIRMFKDTYGDNASKWDYQTKKQYNRLLNRLQGYKDQYQNLVAEYNARTNMTHKRVFKDKLPYEMEEKFWTGDIVP